MSGTQALHKALFPLSSSDFLSFFFAIGGLVISSIGGVGGGGILVPIYTLVMGFNPKHSIPLSNVTVLGGAMANFLLNYPKRHPNPSVSRPLIDWDLVAVMEPLTMAGALIGAFINKVLSEGVIAVMLVVLLLATARSTIAKANKIYQRETAELKRGPESEMIRMAERSPSFRRGQGRSLSGGGADGDGAEGEEGNCFNQNQEEEEEEDDDECGDAGHAYDEEEDDAPLLRDDDRTDSRDPSRVYQSSELRKILKEEAEAPVWRIASLVGMCVVVLVLNLVKGGGGFSPLGIKCGSPGFWTTNAIILLWIGFYSFLVRLDLLNRFAQKERINFRYVEGDVRWTPRNTFIYPTICAVAGLCAGMFGIGGGIVKGPLMLAMNVHPSVSSATSATMILYTAFTATTSFIAFGLLVKDYALACFVLGFVATYGGQILMTSVIDKTGRSSYIAYSIGGVVLVSAFMMGVQSLIMYVEGKNLASGGICGKEH